MTFAMISQIQAEDVIAFVEKISPRVKNIGGIGASLPPVNKKCQPLARFSRMAGMIAQKADIISSVNNYLFGATNHWIAACCSYP
jgi:uncharacterized protein YoxC